MTRNSVTALLCLFFLSLFGKVAHAQLVYSEPPDLSGTVGSPTALGSLAGGTNTVQGSVNATASSLSGQPTGDLADTFSIVVPASVHVTSITVAVTGFASTNNFNPARFFCPTTNSVATIGLNGGGTSSNLLTPAGTVLSAGTYAFRVETLLTPSAAGSSVHFNYSIAFTAVDCSGRTATITGTPAPCAVNLTVNAGGYAAEIYRSTDPIVPGDLVASLAAGTTTFNDTSPVPGTTYSYRARVAANAGGCSAPGNFSDPAIVAPLSPDAPAAPAITSWTPCGLQWTGDASVDYYVVSVNRADNNASAFTGTIGNTTTWNVPDPNPWYAESGPSHTVYITLTAYRLCQGVSSAGAPTTVGPIVLLPPTISIALTNTPCGISINWTPTTGFTSFTIQRSDGLSFPGVSPILVDTSAVDGVTYTYSIEGASNCPVPTMVGGSSQITCHRGGVTQLPPLRVRDGATATVQASGLNAAFGPTYSWRRGGLSPTDPASVPLVNGGRIGGATTTTLTIQNFGGGDTDTYWCTAHYALSGCSDTTTSTNAFLTPVCPADFNKSGQANVQDIFDFLSNWFTGCP